MYNNWKPEREDHEEHEKQEEHSLDTFMPCNQLNKYFKNDVSS